MLVVEKHKSLIKCHYKLFLKPLIAGAPEYDLSSRECKLLRGV